VTRATHFPPANRSAQWYADDYPGTVFDLIEKLCLHTTEGSGWPGYAGGSQAPNLTALPDFANRRLVWREHFPINMSSRALRHTRTQPTNGDHVVQVELIGTCVPGGPGLYWPDAPEWALAGVAELLGFLVAEWNFPASSTVTWRAYNAPGDSQRLSDGAYNAYRGVLGHQHVPQNDHRDPGALDVARIIELTGGTIDMPLTDADVAKLCSSPAFTKAVREAVWQAGWNSTSRGTDGTERADIRLYYASHPEYAAAAAADAVLARESGALIESVAAAVVTRLAAASLPGEVVTGEASALTRSDVEDAVRAVLREGVGMGVQ
jgi:hypothetical protein